MAEQGDDDFAKAYTGRSRSGFVIFLMSLRRGEEVLVSARGGGG